MKEKTGIIESKEKQHNNLTDVLNSRVNKLKEDYEQMSERAIKAEIAQKLLQQTQQALQHTLKTDASQQEEEIAREKEVYAQRMQTWYNFVAKDLLVDLEQAQSQIQEKITSKHDEYAEVVLSIVNKFGVESKLENKIRDMMRKKMMGA